jgi:hypothetical protein
LISRPGSKLIELYFTIYGDLNRQFLDFDDRRVRVPTQIHFESTELWPRIKPILGSGRFGVLMNAGPGPVTRRSNKARADWIVMNVGYQPGKIFIIEAEFLPISSLEEMSGSSLSLIKSRRVRREYAVHNFRQWHGPYLDRQMEMIAHQAIGY